MKVKELLQVLAACNPDAEVILQKDSEGNGYSPLEGADEDAVYVPDSTYSGAVYSRSWSADEACLSPKEWQKVLKRPSCVVLYPVN